MRSRSMRIALGGVALFGLLAAAACGGSSSPASPTPPAGGGGPAADSSVVIAGFAFSPSSISVKVGQSVAWQNNDSVGHSATSDSGSFDTGIIGSGGSSSAVVMSTAGTFTYHCSVHPNMRATLNVQ